MAPLLEFRNVTKTYSKGVLSRSATTALDDVSLTLNEEDPTIMTVAGESGSGKTTLAMLLLGFIQPTTGQILYKGKDITTLSGEERMSFSQRSAGRFSGPIRGLQPVLHRRSSAQRADRKVQAGQVQARSAQDKWKRHSAPWACGQKIFSVAFRISCRAASASASMWRARCCLSQSCWWPTSQCRWSMPQSARDHSGNPAQAE